MALASSKVGAWILADPLGDGSVVTHAVATIGPDMTRLEASFCCPGRADATARVALKGAAQ